MFKPLKSKKGQTGGLITGLIFGVASLVIAVIISFVIVSTLSDADLLTAQRTTATVTNETGGYLNGTGYQLTGLDSNYVSGGISITALTNATDGGGELIPAGNYSISSTGLLTNLTSETWSSVNISYTDTVYSIYETSEQGLGDDFTGGVDNVSEKLPTVLLIAAVVLILGVLVLLVGAWQRMSLGSGGGI